MTQATLAQIQYYINKVKRELKYNYMATTELEKTNLEAHVDLCSERYDRLHDRLSAIEVRLGRISEDMRTGQKSHSKTLIATAGTVLAGVLSTIVVILMKFPN
tara:strand:- start:1170 stop:1478 length:309 start_codon:yes stop_codon:yes gene_type:complete